jgi:hypothetical protein
MDHEEAEGANPAAITTLQAESQPFPIRGGFENLVVKRTLYGNIGGHGSPLSTPGKSCYPVK